MFIVNQDRDAFIFIQKKNNINIKVNTYNNNIIGYSLYYKYVLLGTFDTLMEAILELNNIKSCCYNIYVVNGFTDYENCFKGGSYNV